MASGVDNQLPLAKPRWGVLISGRGSNLASLLQFQDEIDIRVVFSSNDTAEGLLRAKRAGVPTRMVPVELSKGKPRVQYDRLSAELEQFGVTHVLLAGYMKIVPASFVSKWAGRIVNLHPSMLPNYPGLNSIAQAHADNAEIGVTVHEVNEEVDAGRIISQKACLKSGESARYSFGLAEFLVHVEEQRLLGQALRKWGRASDGGD